MFIPTLFSFIFVFINSLDESKIWGLNNIGNLDIDLYLLSNYDNEKFEKNKLCIIKFTKIINAVKKLANLNIASQTSALDNITQQAVANSLDKLNCTRIAIAHRLSTVQNCDRILVLDEGRICEEGTYEELIEKDGFFSDKTPVGTIEKILYLPGNLKWVMRIQDTKIKSWEIILPIILIAYIILDFFVVKH